MNQLVNDHQGDLFARIVRFIENGGSLTEPVLAYIETTLFSPQPDRLAAFLSDDNNCERDTLLDLIFYPDSDIQADLEPLLETSRYSPDDEADLHDRLIAEVIIAQVSMPDGRLLVGIQVPDFIKSQYLTRLKIAWQMDSRVSSAIEKGMSEKSGPIAKVRLRNAGLRFTDSRRVFLCRFFERMVDSECLTCLDLVLSLLETAGEGLDGYGMLARHKRLLFRSLQQTRRFETLLQRSNMETLMLQGVRAPYASPDEMINHMRLIDLICFRMFGKTVPIEMPMEEPVRQISNLGTQKAAFRSLLR